VRVLVFSKLFWPEGAELATYLVVGLLSRRFDVTVVSSTARPEPAVLRRARYLRWDALGSRFKPIEWLRLLAGARHIRRLLERADIVYIPSHTLLPLAAAAKRLRPGVKVVVHLHNFQPLAYTSVLLAGRGPGAAQDFLVERMEHGSLPRAVAAGLGHYANRAVSLLALRRADAVVCVSRRQRDILLRHVPGLRGKTAVIYNPPPPLPGTSKELGDEPVFVYAGGSSYVKGFHVLLELFRKAAKGGVCRSCRFYVVAGRGSEDPLKPLSAALGSRLIAMDRMPRGEYLKLHGRA
jgi:glycosyltransferase involved in cell wall biosynthesis